jgi:hypothetical protein
MTNNTNLNKKKKILETSKSYGVALSKTSKWVTANSKI